MANFFRRSNIWLQKGLRGGINDACSGRYFCSTSFGYDSTLLHHRDAFVIDHDFDLHSKLLLHHEVPNGTRTSHSRKLRHPSSNHIIAKYAAHIYNTSAYHFNNFGEYTFDLAPSDLTSSLQKWTSTNKISLEKNITDHNDGFHDLVVWPDQIVIRNLQKHHIPAVYKMCLHEYLWDVDSVLREIKSHDNQNDNDNRSGDNQSDKEGVTIQRLADVLVVVSCESSTIAKAKETLLWFETCFREQEELIAAGSDHLQSLSVSYLLTSDRLRGPQQGVNILILEGNSHSGSSISRGSSSDATNNSNEAGSFQWPHSDKFENVITINEVRAIVSSVYKEYKSSQQLTR